MSYNEEVICGHLVTSEVKKLWDVQLSCFDQLKKICEKHGIKYFAGGGTLLGTVRHKGFIPWDDDMDFFMFQEDYDRFAEVAPKEIKEPFFFQHYTTQKGYGTSISRIRRVDTTGCTQYEYDTVDESYCCGIFIDIFPLQYVADKKIPLSIQKLKVGFYRTCISGYGLRRQIKNQHKISVSPYALISLLLGDFFSLFCSHAKLSALFLSACNNGGKKSTRVGIVAFLGFKEKYIWPIEYWKETIMLPFEDVMMCCPKKYDAVLRHQFGDYLKPVKGAAQHSVAIIDADTPYGEKLKEHFKEQQIRK